MGKLGSLLRFISHTLAEPRYKRTVPGVPLLADPTNVKPTASVPEPTVRVWPVLLVTATDEANTFMVVTGEPADATVSDDVGVSVMVAAEAEKLVLASTTNTNQRKHKEKSE